MESEVRKRRPSEVLKRGYADEEVRHIYELARLSLENGQLRSAEKLFTGITEVAPEFAEGWLGLSYIHTCAKRNNEAIFAARQALRVSPDCVEALLFLIAGLLTAGDVNSAGTYLGEVGERVESGSVNHPQLMRFYRAQLARYQAR